MHLSPTMAHIMGPLNSALRNTDNPSDLSRVLLAQYLALDEDGRTDVALALIMEIGAREALNPAPR
jgi:hypothetical protein